jgi:hypothetical protein
MLLKLNGLNSGDGQNRENANSAGITIPGRASLKIVQIEYQGIAFPVEGHGGPWWPKYG